MREAIGSSWLFYLLIIFLLIYVFFMAFVMNYASAYRAANYVVTQIEVCQGESDCGGNDFDNWVKNIREKYHYVGSKNGGLKICCMANGNGSVYRVKLPVDFEVPFLGAIDPVNIKAETKTISRSCNNDIVNDKCN